jgi:hypothetical protein
MAVNVNEIDFVDEKERELFAAVMLGDDIKEFLRATPVGQYLHHRAKLTIQQAEVDALKVNPDGLRGWFYARRKLREIRARADAARMLIGWFGDALADANNAEVALKEYRNP